MTSLAAISETVASILATILFIINPIDMVVD